MARRWMYFAQMHWEDGTVSVHRMGSSHNHQRTPNEALAELSRMLESQVRTALNAIDAIRAGKVTRTWEKRK